jgi:hypothetical protein
MLRENKDVFTVFTDNLLDYVYEQRLMNSIELAEPIVHHMFLDLTMPEVNKRLVYVIYKLTILSMPGNIKRKES